MLCAHASCNSGPPRKLLNQFFVERLGRDHQPHFVEVEFHLIVRWPWQLPSCFHIITIVGDRHLYYPEQILDQANYLYYYFGDSVTCSRTELGVTDLGKDRNLPSFVLGKSFVAQPQPYLIIMGRVADLLGPNYLDGARFKVHSSNELDFHDQACREFPTACPDQS